MRVLRFLPFLLFATTLPAADLTVGSITARAGQRATGFLSVPAGSDAALDIPVIVIHGARPGPVLALVAGAHGTEYASILALEKLAQTVNPADLSGSLIILPLLNPASFAQRVPHLNPVDGKNMNRFYPGSAGGTQTERALFAVANEVVGKCDYLLDYHGGDLDENLRRYAYWSDSGNERLDSVTKKMALAFGLDHIIMQNLKTPVPPGGAVTLTRYAIGRGKPAIAVEAGHAGTTNAEDVDVLVDGALSVMRHLKILSGAAAPVENPLWISRYAVVTSERDGIFYPLVGPEAYVTKGIRV